VVALRFKDQRLNWGKNASRDGNHKVAQAKNAATTVLLGVLQGLQWHPHHPQLHNCAHALYWAAIHVSKEGRLGRMLWLACNEHDDDFVVNRVSWGIGMHGGTV
jgi:hypothetical protein